MGTQPVSKQFLQIRGVPILAHTLKKFEDFPSIDQIILVTRRQERVRCEQIVTKIRAKKVGAIVEGGKKRQDSVFNGLMAVDPYTEIVLIHDGVRMFITEEMLISSIQAARDCGASITAVPAKDTVKKGIYQDKALFVSETLDRTMLWQVQTPQTFQYQLILTIYQKARECGISGTDDAMLAEHFGHPVRIVSGSYRNIKVTTPDDLLIAEAFLQDDINTGS